jgi:membrane associated rhomboid family serine protease
VLLLAIAAAAIAGSLAYAFARKAPLSLTTPVALMIVFIAGYALLESDPANDADALALGYSHVPGAADSPPTALFTAMYLHLDLRHLLFNVLGMVFLLPVLEERIGTARFALVYLASGVIAAAGYLLVHWGDAFFLLGASGAISGALGAFARLYPHQRVQLLLVPMPPVPILFLAAGFVAVSALLGAMGVLGNVAWEAHAIGTLAGFLLAKPVERLNLAVRSPEAIDTEALAPLAVTPHLVRLLGTIRAESVPEVRDAWVDQFLARATCPSCGKPLRRRGRSVRSECGWRLRV